MVKGILTRLEAGLAACWLAVSCLVALLVRSTAIIPANEPIRSQFLAEANAQALQIFIVVASPAIVCAAGVALWRMVKR